MILATDLDALRRPHSVCDDSHYTCPQSPEAWVEAGAVRCECNCGADAHNAKIDALLETIVQESAPEPSTIDRGKLWLEIRHAVDEGTHVGVHYHVGNIQYEEMSAKIDKLARDAADKIVAQPPAAALPPVEQERR